MIKKVMLKRFRKILKLLRVSVIPGECYLLNIFSVMKLHLSQNCQLYENFIVIVLKAPFVSIRATRLKENLLKLNPNVETSRFISFKNHLAVALGYSREHSLQTNATHLSIVTQTTHNEIFEKYCQEAVAKRCSAKRCPQKFQ